MHAGAVGDGDAAHAGARDRAQWLPHAVFAVGAVTIAVGLIVRRFTDTPIGAPWPPSLGNPDIGADPLLALSLALFAAAVVLAPRLLDARLRPAAVAAILLGGTLVLRLALAAGRGGTGAWDRVFDVGALLRGAERVPPGPAGGGRARPARLPRPLRRARAVVPGPRGRPSARPACWSCTRSRSTPRRGWRRSASRRARSAPR